MSNRKPVGFFNMGVTLNGIGGGGAYAPTSYKAFMEAMRDEIICHSNEESRKANLKLFLVAKDWRGIWRKARSYGFSVTYMDIPLANGAEMNFNGLTEEEYNNWGNE